jgi:hypothetical protein
MWPRRLACRSILRPCIMPAALESAAKKSIHALNAEWRFQHAWEDYQVLIPPFDIRRFKLIDELG